MEWMILPLKRYADFSGRSRRMEYWMFVVFTILVNIAFMFIMLILGGGAALMAGGLGGENPAGAMAMGGAVGLVYILNLLFSLAILIPSIAVGVRRLHDTNRSGWWLLLPIAPYLIGLVLIFAGATTLSGSDSGFGAFAIIGGVMVFAALACAIALLVFFFLPGTVGPNRFGPDPKNPDANLESVFS